MIGNIEKGIEELRVCWAKYVKYGEVADIPYAVEVLESLRNCIYEQAEEIPMDCLYVAW